MTRRHVSTVGGAGPEGVLDAIRDHVWRALAKASFAVVGCVNPSGEPRSSGVVYKVIRGRMYVAVARDSWKARHIAANGRVTVTATVPRGGALSLVFPIPPATITFQGRATVYPADSPQARSAIEQLKSLLPEEGRDSASIIEIVPEGAFVTYGIGVPLLKLRDPVAARARVSVARGTAGR
jgi:predicted pyridoxine 5'-phosphate oxidase superfamily flavin-nucleotide-binding protein